MNEPTLTLIKEWAHEAGSLALSYLRKENKISSKSARDLVTEADIAVDTFLRKRIETEFPGHTILSEELSPTIATPQNNTDAPRWVIDPIDGTHNFARGHQHSAISIAFAQQGVVTRGVVYNPFAQEVFSAEKGNGAFLNDTAIKASGCQDLKQALVGVGRPLTLDETSEFTSQIEMIFENCFGFRRIGAAAIDICWVACGRLDIFFESLHPWDIAAARLIASEAGCTIGHFGTRHTEHNACLPSDLNGRDFLVSTPKLFNPIQTLLEKTLA